MARLGRLHLYFGMTGYGGICTGFAMALSDDAVHAVVLDIDTRSGKAAGCFGLVDAIHAARFISASSRFRFQLDAGPLRLPI